MARLLTPRFQACPQARDERIGLLPLRGFREAHDFARGFRGEQTLELLLIFVAKFACVEPVLEGADELLGQRDLSFVRRPVGAGSYVGNLDDLLRVSQRVEQQVAAARLERADIPLVAQRSSTACAARTCSMLMSLDGFGASAACSASVNST
jgi:hypothetical protein